MTCGSSPVSAASVEANCCCPLVSVPWTIGADEAACATGCAETDPWAWASSSAKLTEAVAVCSNVLRMTARSRSI